MAAAVLSLLGAGPAQAQWAAKPAPPLPRSVLDQAWSGSVVLGLVFESNGHVRDAQIIRSSGIDELDNVARQGALRWRLDPSALHPSDMTVGRRHMIKFYQNARVSRRVEPVTAFWKEL
ncbi:MAG: TonB family protein [Chthoniobacterales bacterium]